MALQLPAWLVRLLPGTPRQAPEPADYERIALIAEHTSKAVNIFASTGEILWANDSYVALTGYSLEELIGAQPAQLLRCADSDPAVGARIDNAVKAGLSVREHILNQGKQGQQFWLDLEIQPLADADGVVRSFMSISTDISESKALDQALKARNVELELMANLARVGAWRYDVANGMIWWSEELLALYELPPGRQPRREDLLRLYSAEAIASINANVIACIQQGTPFEIELPTRTAQGRSIVVRIQGRAIIEAEKVVGVIGATQDVTSLVATREALSVSSERLELAAQGARIGPWDWHTDSNRTWISPHWWQIMGYDPDQMPETIAPSEEPVHPDDFPTLDTAWSDFYNNHRDEFLAEYRTRDADGNWRWIQSLGRVVSWAPDGFAHRVSGVFIDIDARKQADEQRRLDEEHLWLLANMDNLTKLPNRGLFFTRLDAAIAKAGREGHKVFAGIVDLDRFKEVNDSFGHAIGDEYLSRIAERLHASVSDADMVARLSGDEFAFFLADVTDEALAETKLNAVLEAVCTPVDLTNLVRRGGGSIGVAVYPEHADQRPELMRRADIALYEAKSAGRRMIKRFSTDMERFVNEGRDLRQEFERAIDQGEVIAFYQPVISADRSRISSFEALARWRHPTKGIVGPAEFYSALSEPQLARLLGRHMRTVVFSQIAAWRDAGVDFGRVAFNVVAADFTEGAMAEDICSAIASGQIAPADICVEVTEGVLLDGAATSRIRDDLRALSQLGVSIAFDDFGTGFASLSHLREYPIDCLKIDRSFVLNLPGSERDLEIIRTIGTLAGALGLKLIAEGVETEDQAELVCRLGATDMQGYMFSKPMHPDRVPTFITRFTPTLSHGGSPLRRSVS